MFEFLLNTSERAVAINLARGDVRQVLTFTSDLTGHETVGPPMTRLQTAVADSADHLAKRAPDLSRTGLTKEAEGRVDRSIQPAFAAVVEATLKARRDTDAEYTRLHTPRFDDNSVPAVRAELRGFAQSLKVPDRIAAAQNDPYLAAALIEGGLAMSGLPADMFERLRREMAIGQLATVLTTQHEFKVVATADDPVAGQPDWEGVRRVAADRLDRLDGERDLIARVPATLSHVVNAVGLMLEESRPRAFERLSA